VYFVIGSLLIYYCNMLTGLCFSFEANKFEDGDGVYIQGELISHFPELILIEN
jgi:hypothetical protein